LTLTHISISLETEIQSGKKKAKDIGIWGGEKERRS